MACFSPLGERIWQFGCVVRLRGHRGVGRWKLCSRFPIRGYCLKGGPLWKLILRGLLCLRCMEVVKMRNQTDECSIVSRREKGYMKWLPSISSWQNRHRDIIPLNLGSLKNLDSGFDNEPLDYMPKGLIIKSDWGTQ